MPEVADCKLIALESTEVELGELVDVEDVTPNMLLTWSAVFEPSAE